MKFRIYLAHLMSIVFAVMMYAPAVAQDKNETSEKSAEEQNAARNPQPEKTKEPANPQAARSEGSGPCCAVNFPETQAPIELHPPHGARVTLKTTDNSRAVYEAIGRQGKINVLFDPDYAPRNVSIDVSNVPFQDALKIAAFQSRTFWRAVTSDTIFVAADTLAKRREYEQQIIKTYYFPEMSSPRDMQDIINALRTVIEVQRIQQLPQFQAFIVRATTDQMTAVDRLMDEMKSARARTWGQYKLQFRINESNEDKKGSSRVYDLLLEPNQTGKLRIGPRIPIQTSDKDKTYFDAGKNIDCEVRAEGEHNISLRLTVEFSDTSHDEKGAPEMAYGNPLLQQMKIDINAILELGVPTVVSSFQDPISKHNFQVEATAIRTKTKE